MDSSVGKKPFAGPAFTSDGFRNYEHPWHKTIPHAQIYMAHCKLDICILQIRHLIQFEMVTPTQQVELCTLCWHYICQLARFHKLEEVLANQMDTKDKKRDPKQTLEIFQDILEVATLYRPTEEVLEKTPNIFHDFKVGLPYPGDIIQDITSFDTIPPEPLMVWQRSSVNRDQLLRMIDLLDYGIANGIYIHPPKGMILPRLSLLLKLEGQTHPVIPELDRMTLVEIRKCMTRSMAENIALGIMHDREQPWHRYLSAAEVQYFLYHRNNMRIQAIEYDRLRGLPNAKVLGREFVVKLMEVGAFDFLDDTMLYMLSGEENTAYRQDVEGSSLAERSDVKENGASDNDHDAVHFPSFFYAIRLELENSEFIRDDGTRLHDVAI